MPSAIIKPSNSSRQKICVVATLLAMSLTHCLITVVGWHGLELVVAALYLLLALFEALAQRKRRDMEEHWVR